MPAGLAVEVTIVSGEAAPRRITLGTKPPRVLEVPAGGRVSELLHGLRRGVYRVSIAGGAYATLVIGTPPGP
ncbi:MAG: hypothetical protein QOK31_1041 [Solirubrobacteraceae bacterium]|nr:hypothetical protein [Solirubrobacteraceae bacterium]